MRVFLAAFAVVFGWFTAVSASDGEITLKRTGEANWIASYCFDEPVDAFKFTRPMTGDMRQKYWQVGDAAFELTYEPNGRETTATIQRTDGAAFRCVSLTMQTYTNRPEKNYFAFSTFSDGGASLYTGYLTGIVHRVDEWFDADLRAKYVPLEGSRVFTRDPSRLTQQFVYYGKQDVLERDGAVAVIDPAVPAAAREIILDTIPEVNAQMGTLFGVKKAPRYMIFMAAGELLTFDGYTHKGGTMERQVLFTLKGPDVIKVANGDPTRYAKLSAHEIIHLWQYAAWETLGNDRPWMHEGSADALSYELMRRIGHYDAIKYGEAWETAEKRCVSMLERSSVHEGPSTGNFGIVYQCGATINHLVGGLLDADDWGRGLWKFWGEMAAWSAVERSGPQSEDLFFKTLAKLGVVEEKQAAIRAFLETKSSDPAAALQTLKEQLGLLNGAV